VLYAKANFSHPVSMLSAYRRSAESLVTIDSTDRAVGRGEVFGSGHLQRDARISTAGRHTILGRRYEDHWVDA
jgi:hypothetical protein